MSADPVPAIGTVLGIGGPPALAPPVAPPVRPIGVRAGIAGLSAPVVTPPDPTPVNPLTVTLSSPTDQASLASGTPTFVVGVDTSLQDPLSLYTLHLQYADNQAMNSPTELTVDFDAVDAGAFIPATTAVPATTWWRARVGQGAIWRSAWAGPQSFTVTASTPDQTPISWSVLSPGGARSIHVWHLYPPAAAPGDTVTVYGQAFSDTGKVLLGGTPVAVQAWNFVAQQGNPDDTRHISGTDITPEHWEAVITVSGISPPGGALEVTG